MKETKSPYELRRLLLPKIIFERRAYKPNSPYEPARIPGRKRKPNGPYDCSCR